MSEMFGKNLLPACLLLLICAEVWAVRIVSTSPQATELLFQLGKGKSVVATSDLSLYPTEASSLPRVGPWYLPSVERILLAKPNWVISDSHAVNFPFEPTLKAQNLRFYTIDFRTVGSLLEGSRLLLRTIFGEEQNRQIAKYERCLGKLQKGPAFRFLAITWPSPAIIFGQNTFLSNILSLVGGVNVAPKDWQPAFPQVAEEWIIRQSVDAVFYLDDFPDSTSQMKRLSSRWWPGKSIRLQGLSPDHFARATFTPFYHLDEISVQNRNTGVKSCLEQDI